MPPKRTSATVRAAAPMTAAAVEQLIESRVSVTLANHKTLRNSINGYGDEIHNSHTRLEELYALRFKKIESVFHISNYAVENQKTLKKMMTDKYCPRGEIKKLKIELWNLKVKGTDVASYTLRFQELALMCGRMFHEESDEVKKYVGGLPDMIRGNVIQAEQKRKLKFNAGNNQGHQQQNKRQNIRRAYTIGPGKKKESSGPNGNNNNRGNSGTTQNAGTCYECGVQGHLKRDCLKLKNRNRGNQCRNDNAPVKVNVCR
ncbi:putative reverse transcriptase domain-containing protein [Tanacetum coccineum]